MILITGATGFIGAHLTLHLLESGKSVRAIYRSEKSQTFTKKVFALYDKGHLFEKINWMKADVCDVPALESAFEGITQVFHCAAMISYDPSDEPIMRKVNIEGTANLVNMSLEKKVEKFVHLSSVAALGDPLKPGDTVDEETDWNPEKPHTDYAITKYGGEMEVWRGWQEGLNVVVVVPPVVLGPIPDSGEKQGSGQIFSAIKNGFSFYTDGSTAFIAVKDLVAVMETLMDSGISGERFIALGEHRDMKWMADTIASAYGVKAPSVKAGNFLLRIALASDWFLGLFGKKRLLFKDAIPALVNRSVYSDEKLKKAIGFTPTPLSEYLPESVRLMEKTT